MPKHQVETKFLKDYEFTHKIAGSYGKGTHKSLVARVRVRDNSVVYEVIDHLKVIGTYHDVPVAAKVYNEV